MNLFIRRTVLSLVRNDLSVQSVRPFTRDIGQPTSYTHPELLATGEILPGMHKEEFSQRRTNFMKSIAGTHVGMTQEKHLVVIPGAQMRFMTADIPYRFHQNTDFLYLSGYLEPDSVLLLESQGELPNHKAILYVRHRDPHKELWDGPRPGPSGALELTGVHESYTISELGHHLETKYSTEGYTVWYNSQNNVHSEHNETIINGLTSSPESRVSSVHNPTAMIAKLRLIKSSSEIALMRRAGEITSQAFTAAMAATRPGVSEVHIESAFEHSIKLQGAQWMSFPPVVAGGNRANCLHYIANNQTLESGELILMDAGCEYWGYCSDVTRTWPVGGAFSSEQEVLYEIIKTTKDECIQLCQSGVTLNYLHSSAVDILATQLKNYGILSDRISTSKLVQTINELYPHHIGHYLGLDVHDTMSVDRNTELCPGMVITIEPGLYIPLGYSNGPLTDTFRRLQGVGIRLEDDVLVTADGPEVLNSGTPQTPQVLTQLIGSCH